MFSSQGIKCLTLYAYVGIMIQIPLSEGSRKWWQGSAAEALSLVPEYEEINIVLNWMFLSYGLAVAVREGAAGCGKKSYQQSYQDGITVSINNYLPDKMYPLVQ